MCHHRPQCPPADAADRDAARTVSAHPEQGWSLLCNGVVVFDDTGELLPDGGVIPPHRPTDVPGGTSPARRPPTRTPLIQWLDEDQEEPHRRRRARPARRLRRVR